MSQEGSKHDPANVETHQKIKLLTNLKKVPWFFNMTGFYRKYIRNFAKTAQPNQEKYKIYVGYKVPGSFWGTEIKTGAIPHFIER